MTDGIPFDNGLVDLWNNNEEWKTALIWCCLSRNCASVQCYNSAWKWQHNGAMIKNWPFKNWISWKNCGAWGGRVS